MGARRHVVQTWHTLRLARHTVSYLLLVLLRAAGRLTTYAPLTHLLTHSLLTYLLTDLLTTDSRVYAVYTQCFYLRTTDYLLTDVRTHTRPPSRCCGPASASGLPSYLTLTPTPTPTLTQTLIPTLTPTLTLTLTLTPNPNPNQVGYQAAAAAGLDGAWRLRRRQRGHWFGH